MADQIPNYAFENEWHGPASTRHGLKPVRTAAPTELAVSLQEIKRQCRAELFNDDDADLQAYLEAAIDHLDGYSGVLGRALVTQTWRQDFRTFAPMMRLPLEPVQSVSAITYYDGNNAVQTLSTDVYAVHTDARSAYVALKANQAFPSTYDRHDAVSVTFVAGYGGASAVPSRLKAAIRLHAADMYENREMGSEDKVYPTLTYERLVKPFVRVY